MKRLLVGSVYAPSQRNQAWYGLQHRYLRQTLGDGYTHAVWLNRVKADPFVDSVVVGRSDEPSDSSYNEHSAGLNRLLAYFAADRDHEDYLILDSDAFPFRDGWLDKLCGWLAGDDLLPERSWASAVRCENLDTFPHPCVVFIRGGFLRRLAEPARYFDFSPATCRNLAGFTFEDVGCGLPVELAGRQVWQPMPRSNVWNPHPVLAAVYGGLFYHHGAGSRPPDIRAVALRTFDHYVPRFAHVEIDRCLFQEISCNPELFLRQLAGLQP